MTQPDETERTKFESFFHGWNHKRDEDGIYEDSALRLIWIGWIRRATAGNSSRTMRRIDKLLKKLEAISEPASTGNTEEQQALPVAMPEREVVERVAKAIDVAMDDFDFVYMKQHDIDYSDCVKDIAKAAIAAHPQPDEEYKRDYDVLTCDDCGGRHDLDSVVESEQWNKFADTGDLLCIRCIDKRATAKGLKEIDVRFYFVGHAVQSKLYEGEGNQPDEAIECVRALREALIPVLSGELPDGDIVPPATVSMALHIEAAITRANRFLEGK